MPDGHLVYATETWEIDAFVEVDRGTESPSRFASKIAEYIAVCHSGTWRAQLPSWSLVLTVTPTAARATPLRRATENVLRLEHNADCLARVARIRLRRATDLVEAKGPLGEIAGREGLYPLIPPDAEDTRIDGSARGDNVTRSD